MIDIKDKMALIQSIYIDAKEKSLSISDCKKLNEILLKTDHEFISLAYEEASMVVATKNIEKSNTITDESESISKIVLSLNCLDVSKKLTSLKQGINLNAENFFFDWISKIEQTL